MAKTVLVQPIPNREITAAARESLKGYFGKCALIAFALFIAEFLISFTVDISDTGIAEYIINGVVNIFCSTILGLAYFKFLGKISDGEENPSFKSCVDISLKRFAISALAGWYAGLIIILKFFLLIVPGVMAVFDYSMVPYIIYDDPDIRISDALKLSRRLMYGHRWQSFLLGCRFIGWGLLCLLTLGIGFFWLAPYSIASYWKFYRSITPAPDSPEAAELPELKPYSGMSIGWRIFWFIILVLIAAVKDCANETKADRFVNRIEAATQTDTAADAPVKAPAESPAKQQ